MQSVRRVFPGRACAAAASVVLCLATIGCGGSDGTRVSGKVTFDGKPVPAGKIYFKPDSGKGNSGPAGYADIVNGAYDTSAANGKGTNGGAMLVEIEGTDPGATTTDPSGEQLIKRLFSGYQTTADLPKSAATQDFDVPLTAGNKPKPQDARPNSGGV